MNMYESKTKQNLCQNKNKDFIQKSNDMMIEIKRAMEETSKDPDVIWRASVMHHPLFGIPKDYQ